MAIGYTCYPSNALPDSAGGVIGITLGGGARLAGARST